MSNIINPFSVAASYTKPSLLPLSTGQTSTVTSNSAGYLIDGIFGIGTETYYLDCAKSSGKWYWEVTWTSGQMFHGIADDVVTSVLNGGYSSKNTGVWTYAGFAWIDSAWTGTAVIGSWPGAGAVLGFALDMSSSTRTLKIYVNNTLGVTLEWTGGGTPVYPMVCPYAVTQINLNTGCVYSPPSGYSYI